MRSKETIPGAKNFTYQEFDSKDGSPMPEYVKTNITELARNLQVLRDFHNKPVIINSGYRSPKHNEAVGGVPNSQHLTGRAADIRIPGLTPTEIAQSINLLINQGKMKEGAILVYNTFVHYDTRGFRVRNF